jgi:hypothetical protein
MISFAHALPIAAVALALPPATHVSIQGEFVKTGATLDSATWARLPSASTEATDPDEKKSVYAGVRLAGVLRDAGVPVGEEVRGKAARAYVVVSAADRYVAIFSLAELASTESRCAPVLADARDAMPLPSDVGPLRIVAPCDQTQARWVRQVTGLTIIVAPDPASP